MSKIDWDSNTKICSLAWGHIHIDTTSRVAPCCQAMHIDESKLTDDIKLYSIHDVDVIDAINSPGMKSMRKAMLANEDHYLCSMCDRMEHIGVQSPRENHNTWNLHKVKNIVEKTNPDGSINSEDFKPFSTDLRMSNLCNLKCRSCSGYASSTWHDEEKIIVRDFPELSRHTPTETKIIKNNFIEQTKQYLNDVDYMYWAGGEPFILKEHFAFLQHLIDTDKAKNIRLAYNTNLTVTEYKKKSLYENYFKHFKQVMIQGSIDGMDSVAEYMRTGSKWQQLKDNFEYFHKIEKETNGHLIIRPCITVSIMNIHHLPEFIKFCFLNDWVEVNIPVIVFNFMDNYSSLCITHLHKEEKQKIKESFEELYKWLKDFNSPDSIHTIDKIIQIMFEDQPTEDECMKHVKNAIHELDTYDITANLNWKKSLPLLSDYLGKFKYEAKIY